MSNDKVLRVGFGEADITPAPPENDKDAFQVLDSIGFRAVVLRHGDENVTLLTGDFFSFENQMLEKVRSLLADIEWLNPDCVLTSVSHCGGVPILFPAYFSQPCEYLRQFGEEKRYAAAAARAIRAAVEDLRPARIGLGQSAAPGLNYNRRSHDRDGKLVMSNFMLPYPRPELTYEPVDSNVYALRVDDEPANANDEVRPRAALIVFGCHALCNNDKRGHVSADYPGVARRLVSEVLHVPVAFAAGAIGDAVPNGRGGDSYIMIGEGVGRAAVRALEEIQTLAVSDLAIRQKTLRVPRLDVNEPDTTKEADDGNLRFKAYHSSIAESATQSYTLTAIRFANAALIHLPGEVFVETASAIQSNSRFHPTIVLSGPSADIGYLCPARAHAERGMEPQFAALAGEAEDTIRNAAIELVREL